MDQFKKHELRKWIEGSDNKEKFRTLNKGNSDKVTFTHFLEYGTDLINRLLSRLNSKGAPEAPISNDVERLQQIIIELQNKIRELERENERLKNEVDALKKFENECHQLKEMNSQLRTAHEALKAEYEKTNAE